MNCEKCNVGEMEPTKVARFTGCLIGIGYTLLIPAIVAISVATGVTLSGILITGETTSRSAERAKAETANKLRAIRGLPEYIVEDFKRSGEIGQGIRGQLTPMELQEVDLAMASYNASLAGSAIGGTMAAGMGIMMNVAIYATSIPALIMGFVLLMKKKVWRCNGCGYLFERA